VRKGSGGIHLNRGTIQILTGLKEGRKGVLTTSKGEKTLTFLTAVGKENRSGGKEGGCWSEGKGSAKQTLPPAGAYFYIEGKGYVWFREK